MLCTICNCVIKVLLRRFSFIFVWHYLMGCTSIEDQHSKYECSIEVVCLVKSSFWGLQSRHNSCTCKCDYVNDFKFEIWKHKSPESRIQLYTLLWPYTQHEGHSYTFNSYIAIQDTSDWNIDCGNIKLNYTKCWIYYCDLIHNKRY